MKITIEASDADIRKLRTFGLTFMQKLQTFLDSKEGAIVLMELATRCAAKHTKPTKPPKKAKKS